MSDRLPGTSTSNPILYRGYEICLGPAYTRDSQWQFVHEDYDGPEDGRCGMAASEAECRAEIDGLIEEQLFDALSRIVKSGCALSQGLRMNAQYALDQASSPSPDRNPKGGDAKQGSVEDEGRFPAPNDPLQPPSSTLDMD